MYVYKIHRRRDYENVSQSRELALPSGSLAMTVLLRSTPPFLSSVQHTHIHNVYDIQIYKQFISLHNA